MAEPSTAVSLIPTDSPSEDGVLLDHLQRIEQTTKGSYAVHLHLSRLRPEFRKRHFLRIAARTFDALVNNRDVTLYMLSNGDFVLMCREVPIDEVDQPINRIRALFSEDPLTFSEVGSPDDRFTSWLDLSQPTEYAVFFATVTEIVEAERDRRRRELERGADGRQFSVMRGEALEPETLNTINERLKSVRILDLIRQQQAVAIEGGRAGEVLFSEFFISMSELQQRVAPEINLFSSPWMFQFLTETLDRRMLSVLMRQDPTNLPYPVSLNLNVATVLSTGFQSFHGMVGNTTHRVVIEMQTVDIFANMTAFEDAHAWLNERGYRVLLDGLNPLSLSFFDPGLLRPDFVKISWSPEFHSGVPAGRLADIRDVISHIGAERVILARVDSEQAIRWGLGLGVSRFQGRMIDRLIQRTAERGDA